MKIALPIKRPITLFDVPESVAVAPDTRRQIELFLTAALLICGLAFVGGIAVIISYGRLTIGAMFMLTIAAIMLAAYLMGRTSSHMLAIAIASITLNLAPFAYLTVWRWTAPGDRIDTSIVLGALAWLGPALMVAGILLPLRWFLALGSSVSALAGVYPVYLTGGKVFSGIAGMIFTATLVALIVIARAQARRLELIRTKELTDARDRLEERVRERTQHLEQLNNELKEARRATQAAFQSRSEYLAEISHDLRSPLTIILGYSEMLAYQAQSQNDPELTRQLRSLEASARYLTALSQNMIDLAALERGDLRLKIQAVSVPSLYDELCLLAQPLAARNHNSFESRLADGLDKIQTDPLRVRQVLINLLDNAAKFTQGGFVRFEAVPSSGEDGAPGVLFSVSDTGIGIAPAQIKALFQPFPPSFRATRDRYSGAGLGLAITRLLCHRLSGRINVRSRPGQGSTFTVWMPVEPGNH